MFIPFGEISDKIFTIEDDEVIRDIAQVLSNRSRKVMSALTTKYLDKYRWWTVDAISEYSRLNKMDIRNILKKLSKLEIIQQISVPTVPGYTTSSNKHNILGEFLDSFNVKNNQNNSKIINKKRVVSIIKEDKVLFKIISGKPYFAEINLDLNDNKLHFLKLLARKNLISFLRFFGEINNPVTYNQIKRDILKYNKKCISINILNKLSENNVFQLQNKEAVGLVSKQFIKDDNHGRLTSQYTLNIPNFLIKFKSKLFNDNLDPKLYYPDMDHLRIKKKNNKVTKSLINEGIIYSIGKSLFS